MKIRRVFINENEVIEVRHKGTGTVLRISIDLIGEYLHIDHRSNTDGLGVDYSGFYKEEGSKFINELLDSDQ